MGTAKAVAHLMSFAQITCYNCRWNLYCSVSALIGCIMGLARPVFHLSVHQSICLSIDDSLLCTLILF